MFCLLVNGVWCFRHSLYNTVECYMSYNAIAIDVNSLRRERRSEKCRRDAITRSPK